MGSVKMSKKHLVVIGHPDKTSFCYNGIFNTIVRELEDNNETFEIIDVYEDKLHRNREELIEEYKKLITWSTHKHSLMRFLRLDLHISLYQ